jgi:hypothetical protein
MSPSTLHPSDTNYFKAIQFAFLPLAVLILANIIFASTAFDLDKLLENLLFQQTQNSSINLFAEARFRLAWATSLLLFYATFMYAFIFCLKTFRQSMLPRGQIAFAIVALIITALVCGHMAYSAHIRNNYSHIFFFTYEALSESGRYTSWQLGTIKSLVYTLNILAAIVPILTLLTGCCVVVCGKMQFSSKLERCEYQMNNLKMVINVGSTMLVAGILHMIAWLRWPSSLIADKTISQHVIDFSEMLSMYWGTTFSLVMAAFYIPMALSIHQDAKKYLTAEPEILSGKDPGQWLNKHGLSIAPKQQFLEVAVILAPFLAGPIGSALVGVPNALSGG